MAEKSEPRPERVLAGILPRVGQVPARARRPGMEPQKAQVLCMSRPKAHAGTEQRGCPPPASSWPREVAPFLSVLRLRALPAVFGVPAHGFHGFRQRAGCS